jgi:hypothetical protein
LNLGENSSMDGIQTLNRLERLCPNARLALLTSAENVQTEFPVVYKDDKLLECLCKV